ncbi:MAG: hypothetical protein ACR2K1_16090, partial [Saprospiraceae bacterium]
ATVGSNTIKIRKNCDGSGCDISSVTTYTWTGVADPAAPTATKSPDVATVCVGASLTLTGVTDNGGGTGSCTIEYSANDGAWTTSLPSITATVGSNTIKVRKNCDGSGCDISTVTTYTWTAAAALTTAPSPSTASLCISETLEIDGNSSGGTPNYTHQWTIQNAGTTGATLSDIDDPSSETITFDATGLSAGTVVLQYQVTDMAACMASETVTLTISATVSGSITPGSSNVCQGSSTTLTASGGDTYSWSTMESTAEITVMPTVVTTYTVTVSSTAGCSGTASVTLTPIPCIQGAILHKGDGVLGLNNAVVNLTGDQTSSFTTGTNGAFEFSNYTGSNFVITPVKNTGSMFNGVNAADATAIQQHVTGISVITDFYRLVAADCNRSNTVTSLDATLIRQGLLGNTSALGILNTAGVWRFVRSNYVPVAAGPVTLDNYTLYNKRVLTGISGTVSGQNFFAIKNGDVSEAVAANPANKMETETEPLIWHARNRMLVAGQDVDMTFSVLNFEDIAAFQYALGFDPELLEFQQVTVTPNSVPMSVEGNFGAYQVDQGQLRVVWSVAQGVTLPGRPQVFQVRFKALKSGLRLSDAVSLDAAILEPIAFSTGLVPRKVELVFTGYPSNPGYPGDFPVAGTSDFVELLPNRPNPFSGQTTAAFLLPEACEAQLRLLDAFGRTLWQVSKTYPAGYNEELIILESYKASGLMYLELITPGARITRTVTALER